MQHRSFLLMGCKNQSKRMLHDMMFILSLQHHIHRYDRTWPAYVAKSFFCSDFCIPLEGMSDAACTAINSKSCLKSLSFALFVPMLATNVSNSSFSSRFCGKSPHSSDRRLLSFLLVRLRNSAINYKLLSVPCFDRGSIRGS